MRTVIVQIELENPLELNRKEYKTQEWDELWNAMCERNIAKSKAVRDVLFPYHCNGWFEYTHERKTQYYITYIDVENIEKVDSTLRQLPGVLNVVYHKGYLDSRNVYVPTILSLFR